MSDVVALIRVRGLTHVKPQIKDTLKFLGLTRKNHCTVFSVDDSLRGMIKLVNDYVTWGEVNESTILDLLSKRGRVPGQKSLTDAYVKENSSFSDIKKFSEELAKGKAKLKDVAGMKRVFRLNPPIKGFERKGIKKPFTSGGVLGYRGVKINDLISRML